MMATSFYYKWEYVAFLSFILSNFGANLYLSICSLYITELAEPFVIGVSIGFLWIVKSLIAFMYPFLYSDYPLYYSPALNFILGTIMFIFMRPL